MAKLILTNSDAGNIISIPAGTGYEVYGTGGVDIISLASGADATIVGGAGNDQITLAGSPSDYTVKSSGTSLIFTSSTGHQVKIPLTAETDTLKFDNGAQTSIMIDNGILKLGSQAVTTTTSAITGTSGGSGTATTYTVSVNPGGSITEGQSALFTITASQAATSDTIFSYSIQGDTLDGIASAATSADYSPNSGNVTIPAGQRTATVSVAILPDSLIEGAEGIKFNLANSSTLAVLASQTVMINDTAVLSPTYSLDAQQGNINESMNAAYNLYTTNVVDGTVINYTVSGTGITAADFVSNSLNGSVVVNANRATITIPIAADRTTEGTETLNIALDGKALTAPVQLITILDSSTTAPPTYSLGAQRDIANEGTNAAYNLYTTNVVDGTVINYTVSGTGITAADFVSNSLTGSVVVNANRATITIPIAADRTIEGTETLNIALDGKTLTAPVQLITILDSSTGFTNVNGDFGTQAVQSTLTLPDDAFNIFDYASVENNVRIVNYGADDRITLVGATEGFLSVSSNGAGDVTILNNNNGIESEIQIIGIGQAYDIASFNALPVGDIVFA